jgi:hypothetical protein
MYQLMVNLGIVLSIFEISMILMYGISRDKNIPDLMNDLDPRGAHPESDISLPQLPVNGGSGYYVFHIQSFYDSNVWDKQKQKYSGFNERRISAGIPPPPTSSTASEL